MAVLFSCIASRRGGFFPQLKLQNRVDKPNLDHQHEPARIEIRQFKMEQFTCVWLKVTFPLEFWLAWNGFKISQFKFWSEKKVWSYIVHVLKKLKRNILGDQAVKLPSRTTRSISGWDLFVYSCWTLIISFQIDCF